MIGSFGQSNRHRHPNKSQPKLARVHIRAEQNLGDETFEIIRYPRSVLASKRGQPDVIIEWCFARRIIVAAE